ncbi:MAG: NAD(P)-dependent oxidoreductase [Bifidobacterium subtile]|jgi:3-hydroxyisobutyrate dehydrogenase|nr:NAD(P)-dependent oxidoreductase [Bifidobacterium subtile]MCI1257799.1 NAD(P)-dependent oxidoreductase [Bifidobacterium subtile]
MKATVLGTGIMGSGIARSLHAGGLQVTAWNRTVSHAAPLKAEGVAVENDPRVAVSQSDVIIVALYDAESVLSVLKTVSDAAPKDAIWVQTATIGKEGSSDVDRFAREHGVKLIETMMMGSKDQANAGHLTLIGGGDLALFEKAKPALDAMSFKLVYCGPRVGDGTAVKLVCNLWLACITAAACQSVKLLERQGVDPHLFLNVIEGATTDSPYAHIKGDKAIDQDFSPQFEVVALQKDLSLVRTVMESVGFRQDLVSLIYGLYDSVAHSDHAHDDISAVAEAFDKQ